MDLSLYPPGYLAHTPYGDMMMIFLIIYLIVRPRYDMKSLVDIPLLVKMNIIEETAKIIRKKLRRSRPDVFKQVWLGTFDYTFAGQKIHGTVEIKNSDVFTVKENKEWLFNDSSNIQSIINYFGTNRILDIPSWKSEITCNISLRDSHKVSHLFIPSDILSDRHSHNIKWEKKLVHA